MTNNNYEHFFFCKFTGNLNIPFCEVPVEASNPIFCKVVKCLLTHL